MNPKLRGLLIVVGTWLGGSVVLALPFVPDLAIPMGSGRIPIGGVIALGFGIVLAWGDATRRTRRPAVPQTFLATGDPNPPTSPDKVCPDCAETVLAEAALCRFCRHDFIASSLALGVDTIALPSAAASGQALARPDSAKPLVDQGHPSSNAPYLLTAAGMVVIGVLGGVVVATGIGSGSLPTTPNVPGVGAGSVAPVVPASSPSLVSSGAGLVAATGHYSTIFLRQAAILAKQLDGDAAGAYETAGIIRDLGSGWQRAIEDSRPTGRDGTCWSAYVMVGYRAATGLFNYGFFLRTAIDSGKAHDYSQANATLETTLFYLRALPDLDDGSVQCESGGGPVPSDVTFKGPPPA